MILKKCPKCKIEYPATKEYFCLSKNTISGLHGWCKNCKKQIDEKYHKENIVEINKQRKEWRENNKETTREKGQLYREKMKNRSAAEIVVPISKKCSCCGETKESNHFSKDAISKDLLHSYCKKCNKARNKEGYLKHKKKRQIYGKNYQENNKEKIEKRQKNYYQKNKKRIRAYKKEWAQKNAEKLKKYHKEWGRNHRKEIALYCRNKRKNDLNYRILNNLRSRLSSAVKSQYSEKTNRTMELVGCTIIELKRHLESRFGENMAWNNYGQGNNKWSIDHIIPCAYFDLTKTEEQKKCFQYINLAPLWNKENISKNSLYNGMYIRKERKNNHV